MLFALSSQKKSVSQESLKLHNSFPVLRERLILTRSWEMIQCIEIIAMFYLRKGQFNGIKTARGLLNLIQIKLKSF